VLLQAACILKALRRAADTRFELMGWSSTAWADAVRASIEHDGEVLPALKAVIPDEFAAAEAADTVETD
jgi:hypothetical protein